MNVFVSAVDLLRSYDVFVSYAWSDGRVYAMRLRDRLTELGYRCFLDDSEMPGGSDLRKHVSSALRRSSSMIVVVTQGALGSPHVATEVNIFAPLGRPLVPIFRDPAQRSESAAGVLEMLQARVWLDDTTPEIPAAEVITKLTQTFRFVRRSRIFQGILILVSLTFATIAATAAYEWSQAFREKVLAQRREVEVQLQLNQRQNTDLLQSSRQLDGLRGALADIDLARTRLGYIPITTQMMLLEAVDGAREVERFPVQGQIVGVTAAPGNTGTITVDRDGNVSWWDWKGTETRHWRMATDQFQTHLLPSGRAFLLTDDKAKKDRIIDLEGRMLLSFPPVASEQFGDLVDFASSVIAFSPDLRTIKFNSLQSGTMLPPVDAGRGSKAKLTGLRLSQDGTKLAALLSDGRLEVFETNRPSKPIGIVKTIEDARLWANFDLSLLVVSRGDEVEFCDHLGEACHSANLPDSTPTAGRMKVSSVAVSATGLVAITVENRPEILIYQSNGMQAMPALRGLSVPSVAFGQDGSQLLAGDYLTPLTVRRFDLQPRLFKDLIGQGPIEHDGSFEGTRSMMFCSQSQNVAWGGMSGTLRLRDPDGKVSEWHQVADDVTALACMPDGEIAVSGSGANSLKVFRGGLSPKRTSSFQGDATHLAVLENSSISAITGKGGILRMWRPGRSTADEYDLAMLRPQGLTSLLGVITVPETSDVLVVGNNESDSALVVVRLDVSGEPKLRWARRLPDLSVLWALCADPKGDRFLVSGPVDHSYALTGDGHVSPAIEGVMRPGIWSMAYSSRDLVVATSAWGKIGLFTDGQLVAEPFHRLMAPLVIATDLANNRIYIGDSAGRVSELIIDPDELRSLSCRLLQDKGNACTLK